MPHRPHRLAGIRCGNTGSIGSSAHIRATNRQIMGLKTNAVRPTSPGCCKSVTCTLIAHLHNGAHDAPGRIHRKNAHPLRLCASAPDRRTGRNAHLTLADIGMAAFAVFFLQSPSFLSAQKQLETRQGRSNAKTLFGIDRLPSDNHIRSMLDGVPPEHFDPMFHHVIDQLEQQGALDPLRRRDGRMLIALDGTECFTSTSIGCDGCSTRKLKNGEVQNFHAMLAASIVAPGTSSLLPLPPEFVRRRDGAAKQDCEITAAKRWLTRIGPRMARLKPVYLGDDLYCCQSVCQAILDAGGSFLLTCKPASHTTLYEWIGDLPIRDGRDALSVNWFEATISSMSGKRLYHNSFATDMALGRDNVAELAECARARWKVENNIVKALKDGCHLDHSFGHGKITLASLLAMFNLIAFLMQSACDIACVAWKAARAKLAARYRLLDHMKFLTSYVVHQHWDEVMESIATGELPKRPP